MNRLSRIRRTYRNSVAFSLRHVTHVWIEIYSRRLSTSIEAAAKSTEKVSCALRMAIDAGATNAQIHKAMDEAQLIAGRRGR